MKNLNKFAYILLVALLLVGTISTTMQLTAETIEASTKVRLNKGKVTLAVGKTYTLKTRGTSRKATWKTSKKSVATLSARKNKSVRITARKVGTSTITARINGKNYKCRVTVVNPKLNKNKLSLTVGNKSTLKVSGGIGTIKWSTSNKSIASISKKGVVTARKAGKVTITATVNGKKLNSVVTIKAKPKATPTPTPTKKPVQPTPTKKPILPTPTPGNQPTTPNTTRKTNYGVRPYTKANGGWVFDNPIVYYDTKEEMPYEFRSNNIFNPDIDNTPQSPFTMRRWVETAPNVGRTKLVTIKSHTESECPCGKGWGLGFQTADMQAWWKHMEVCKSGNFRSHAVVDEQHQEITTGGYWEYYNPPTNTWR